MMWRHGGELESWLAEDESWHTGTEKLPSVREGHQVVVHGQLSELLEPRIGGWLRRQLTGSIRLVAEPPFGQAASSFWAEVLEATISVQPKCTRPTFVRSRIKSLCHTIMDIFTETH
jgi:hypothetical protein